jgi:hypothetical protein
MAGEDPVTHERLIELSRTLDHALATHSRHWPEPRLRGHVEELIDVEADCGVFGGSGRGCR